MSPDDIRMWRATKSTEFISGDSTWSIRQEKERLRNGVWLGPLALVSGPGGGKTTSTRYLAMCLCCPAFQQYGEPCGACEGCRSQSTAYSGDVHLYRHWEIDCSSISPKDLRRLLAEAAPCKQSVLALDEFRTLNQDTAQPMLLKFAEEYPGILMLAITIGSTERIDKVLSAPLVDRLRVATLARPTVDAMSTFLANCAASWGVEAADSSLYRLLVLAARQSFRACCRVLAKAKADGQLTGGTIQTTLGLADDWAEELLDD